MWDQARQAIASADRMLIGAGAGMGVDSGLPDFRGNEGFWKAYPPFRGKAFHEMANPAWFDRDPEVAWGFYGHRRNLYLRTQPHDGFQRLRTLAQRSDDFAFVFTSNVDGHFQAAGFNPKRVLECHGSIRHTQCSVPCGDDIWLADQEEIEIDESTFRCVSPLPRCRNCSAIARPNILMFGDTSWIPNRAAVQERRYSAWIERAIGSRITALEFGAGTAIPTVRWECESHGDIVIRINPREPEGGANVIGLAAGARESLARLLGAETDD